MANVSNIRGLIPVGTIRGNVDPRVRTYFCPTTNAANLFIGDPVILAGGTTADGKTQLCVPALASGSTSTTPLLGAVVGVDPIEGVASTTNLNLDISYRPASLGMYIRVCDDPQAIFAIQEDGVGGTIAAADGTKNVELIYGAGSTTSGKSGYLVDSSTVGTGATISCKLLGIQNIVNNALGASCKWLVKINNHQLAEGTGSAGV